MRKVCIAVTVMTIALSGCAPKPQPTTTPSDDAAALQKAIQEIEANDRAAEAREQADTQPAVPSAYQPAWNLFLDKGAEKEVLAKLPYDSITLERTPCFGTCPVYRVTFKRDGSAQLDAMEYLPSKGKFIGTVDPRRYARLCYALEKFNFSAMKPRYAPAMTVTDLPTCIVTAATPGKSIAVEDYGQQGPIELWVIQQLLDQTKDQVEWQVVKPAATQEGPKLP